MQQKRWMSVKEVWTIVEEQNTNKGRKFHKVTGQRMGWRRGERDPASLLQNQNSLFKLHLQNIYIYI